MKKIWIIAKRELRSFFDSLIAYILLVLFLGFSGFFTWMFGSDIFLIGRATWVHCASPDGQLARRSCDVALGRSFHTPRCVAHSHTVTNFVACAEHAPKKLDRAKVEQAREMIETLESVKDVRDMTRLLS